MSEKSGVQNYVNTVIFCVVMKIISIIVLGLILLNKVSESTIYFLITIEIGIVVIVIIALAEISKYEKRLAEEAKNILNSKINVISCPDFYTRGTDGNCANKYVTADGKFEYTIRSGENIILSNYVNKDIETICKSFNNDAFVKNPNGASTQKIPWTDISSKCDII